MIKVSQAGSGLSLWCRLQKKNQEKDSFIFKNKIHKPRDGNLLAAEPTPTLQNPEGT